MFSCNCTFKLFCVIITRAPNCMFSAKAVSNTFLQRPLILTRKLFKRYTLTYNSDCVCMIKRLTIEIYARSNPLYKKY